ncbi:MAG TPA: CopG family transcriptional regulator [Solirubrobacter sp.]|nr:CopG family transcriptional regulator [Solirubrobacter sp.]
MRTTVTLDDDLIDQLKRRARERDLPFKDVLNEALRIGLAGGAPAASPYRMRPRELGVRPGVDLTKALALAAELEDTEIVRELEQGR